MAQIDILASNACKQCPWLHSTADCPADQSFYQAFITQYKVAGCVTLQPVSQDTSISIALSHTLFVFMDTGFPLWMHLICTWMLDRHAIRKVAWSWSRYGGIASMASVNHFTTSQLHAMSLSMSMLCVRHALMPSLGAAPFKLSNHSIILCQCWSSLNTSLSARAMYCYHLIIIHYRSVLRWFALLRTCCISCRMWMVLCRVHLLQPCDITRLIWWKLLCLQRCS